MVWPLSTPAQPCIVLESLWLHRTCPVRSTKVEIPTPHICHLLASHMRSKLIELIVTQRGHGRAGNYYTTQQRLPFAYLCLTHCTLHTAGPVLVSGDLEALQRRGGPAWERGPAFLASSLGFQPQDHAAALGSTIWKWTVGLARTRQTGMGLFSRSVLGKRKKKKKVQVNVEIYGPKYQKGKYGNSQRA